MTLQEAADTYVKDSKLTPAERNEFQNMARGLQVKQSAEETGLSAETIRARRKRIYRKLAVDGHTTLLARLLSYVVKEFQAVR